MSKNITLGQLITDDPKKDAVHVAIAPATAEGPLNPGAHVFVANGYASLPEGRQKAVGIVDPFLTEPVKEGEVFWVFVYPNTVKDLRHEWSHPAFPDDGDDAGYDGCRGC